MHLDRLLTKGSGNNLYVRYMIQWLKPSKHCHVANGDIGLLYVSKAIIGERGYAMAIGNCQSY